MALRLPIDVSLPDNWPDNVKHGFLSAVALAHRAITLVDAWCMSSRNPRVRTTAELERLTTEIVLLREELRIKDARMAQIPAVDRPRYPAAAFRKQPSSTEVTRLLDTAIALATRHCGLNEHSAHGVVAVELASPPR